MLWEFLRHGKKENSQPNPIPISKAGTSAELGIGSRLVWVWSLLSTVLQKAAMEVVDFCEFVRWIL